MKSYTSSSSRGSSQSTSRSFSTHLNYSENIFNSFKISFKLIFIISTLLSPVFNSRLNKIDPVPKITADAKSLSFSTDNLVATLSQTNAEAKTGYTAVGSARADSKSDRLYTASDVTAVADASETDKLKKAQAKQETISVFSTDQTGQAYKEQIHSASYKTSTTTTTSLNDKVSIGKTDELKLAEEKKLRNDYSLIKDKSQKISSTNTLTGELGVLSREKKSEIIITIDTSNEKFIIQRIIGNEERVIIVSASKFLKSSLTDTETQNIANLLKGNCNCKKIKDYLIDMLAEV
jgi:hypothetical protein